MKRIYLSPPHMSGSERELVEQAFASNWIAPLGPHVDAFEKELAEYVGRGHAAALSSGTAALHLALILAGVDHGDHVVCSTLTFSATANAIRYRDATPVFVDAHRDSWNMDPQLLREVLERSCDDKSQKPKAVVAVDLYGQCADYCQIEKACEENGVLLIEDAAEALGATYGERKAGSFGKIAALSFNGNKIITTSGGGMLLSDDAELMKKAKFLATQARDPAPHYQHSEIGYNYRMSNVLAAIGRGQLQALDNKVKARRKNFELYEEALGALPGIDFMPEAPYGHCTRWLTCITVNPEEFGATREDIRLALEAEDIESRPVWKPMHLQPVFNGCRVVGGKVSEGIFEKGLCLPSGSNLQSQDLERTVSIVRRTCKNA